MRSSSAAALPPSSGSAVGSAAVPALSACPNMKAISINPNADQGTNGAKSSGMPSGMPSGMASMVPTGFVASKQASVTKKNASPTSSGKPVSSVLANRAISEALGIHVRSDIGELTSSHSIHPTARYADDRLPTDRLLARHEITTLRKVVRSPWKPRLYGRATESNVGGDAGGVGGDSGADPTPTGSVSNGATEHAGPRVDDSEGGDEFGGTATSGSDRMPQSTAAGEDVYETDAGSPAGATDALPSISPPPEDSKPTATASDDTHGVAQNGAHSVETMASETLGPVPSSTGATDGDDSSSGTDITPSESSSAVPGDTGDSSPEAEGGAGSHSQGVPSGDPDQSAGNSESGTSGAMPPPSGSSNDGIDAVTNIGTTVGGSDDGGDKNPEDGGADSVGADSVGDDGTSSSAPNAGTAQDGDDSNSPPNSDVSTPAGGSDSGSGVPGNGENEPPQAGAGSPSAGQDGEAEGNNDNGLGSSPSENSTPSENSSPSDNPSQSEDSSSGLDKTANSSGDDGNVAGEGSNVEGDTGESTPGDSGAITGAGAGAKINASPMAQAPKFVAGQKGTLLFISSTGDVGKSGAQDVNQILASGQPVYEASGEIIEGGVFLVDDQPILTFNPSRVGGGGSPAGGTAPPSISVSPPDEQSEDSQPTGAHSPAGAASVHASASVTYAAEVEQASSTGDEGESAGAPITETMQGRWLKGRVAKKATPTKKGSPKTRTKAGAASTSKARHSWNKATSYLKDHVPSAVGNSGKHSATKSASHAMKTQSSSHVTSALANIHASPTGSATNDQQHSSGGTSSEDTVLGEGYTEEPESYDNTGAPGSNAGSDSGYGTYEADSGGDPSSGGEAGGMDTDGSGVPSGNGGGAGSPPTDGSNSQVDSEVSGGSGGGSDQQLA